MDPRIGEALFFGPREAPLFGCLHLPAAGTAAHAAVIVPPAGHEYLSAHRTIRQLAGRLAERGCASLRFDLRGCGDSSGAKDCGSLADWHDDSVIALDTLRERVPQAALHLIGLRLGASIAASVGVTHGELESVVLWDSVTSGKNYFAAGQKIHRQRFAKREATGDAEPIEILGYAISPTLAREFGDLDLCTLSASPAPRVLAINTNEEPIDDFAAHLRTLGANVQLETIEAPDLWSGDGQVALVQTAVIRAVAEWIEPS